MKTILIAILAVLSVSLAGVLVYQKLNQPEISPIVVNQPIVNQPVDRQSLVSQPVATTSDGTAGWKIYKNEKYGFEIQYPAEAQEVQDKKVFGEDVLFSLNLTPIQTKWNYLSLDIATGISSSSCYFSPLGQSIRKEVREAFTDFCLNVEEDSGTGGGVSRDYYYTIMKNGQYLLLDFHIGYNKYCGLYPEYNCEKFDEVKDTKVFDQMLSTFKFIK